jgi:hypothetical protein
MYELARIIPVEVLLALEPEALGAKLLFLVRSRKPPLEVFLPSVLIKELWPQTTLPNEQTAYPRERRDEIDLALTEAWAWLEAQGLIVGADRGPLPWRRLSRRSRRFESEAEFARYAVARMLPREALHQ